MNDFMLDMALNHFDFSDEQKAKIVAAIPKVQYTANLIKQHKTLINDLIDVAAMVAAQIAKKEAQ